MNSKNKNIENLPEVKIWLEQFLTKENSAELHLNNKFEFRSNESFDLLYSMDLINNIDDLISFILYLNQNLLPEGQFIGIAETHSVRKHRILNKYKYPFNWIYYTGDFLLTRVSPKISWTRKLYYKLSKGKGNVLSKTEILGRFYYLGFKLVKEKKMHDKWFFVMQKENQFEEIPEYKPQMGAIIKLKRIGKKGKTIKVFKFRTMYPYSEFIQEYVYEKNNLEIGGKLKNDFRINSIGKFMRKYWLDELPMIWNVLKGDLKLIGVRPLSQHYLSLYNEDLKNLRYNSKPGLLPPFYADAPKTLEEIQESERRYLLAHQKNPLLTDFQYFFKILNNILIKGKRSA